MSDLWHSPHRAVVLGIDAGESSGWGIMSDVAVPAGGRARLHAHGVAKTAAEIAAAVSRAHDLALDLQRPFVAVGETWSPRGWTPTTYGAVRERWGRWAQALDLSVELELFGGDEPPLVLRALCASWRAGLGLRQVVDASVLARPKKERSRAAWKRSAVLAVKGRFGIDVGNDEAEGICLAVWGAHSQQLADHLAPKPKRRRAS